MEDKEHEQQEKELRPKAKSQRSIKRVLCAEDNPAVGRLLCDALSGSGYEVELAIDGMEALAKAVAWISRFQLLITDHRMPRLDGLALVRHLREVDFPGRILILAGTLGERAAELYGRFHIDGVIHKPVRVTELLSTVDRLSQQPLPSYAERQRRLSK
jgi:CheY-like chemotaxis protein